MILRFKFQLYFKDCLFGGVKLARNSDPDKYVYTTYGIGFDSRSEFLLSDGNVGNFFCLFVCFLELI